MPVNPAETSAQPSIEPGSLLAGKYRVKRILGSGGMGVVLAALHEELDQLVAVKLLRPDLAKTDVAVARFQQEARAAARIQSDHVVRVSDIGTLDDGRVFMVMEYLEGKDLSDLIRSQGRLPIPEAVSYAIQALEAIAHAHAHGIVHRDLKPSNLFLATRADGTKRIKVLDFGISKTSSPLSRSATGPAITTADTILGSPGYMAPEQVRSSKDVDLRADIWSMGVILYELITGVPPFVGETIGEVLAKILEDTPEPLRKLRPEAPEALEQAVMRCMERDRGARFQTAAELAEAIAPFGDTSLRGMTERISLVLGRISRSPAAESDSSTRISLSGGESVSQTAATFEAPAPASAPISGEKEKKDAWAAKNADTASLAAGSWSGKAGRAEDARDARDAKRRIAVLIAAASIVGLGVFFAWRIAHPPAVGALDEHAGSSPTVVGVPLESAHPSPVIERAAGPGAADSASAGASAGDTPSNVPVVAPAHEASSAEASAPPAESGGAKGASKTATTANASASGVAAASPSASASAGARKASAAPAASTPSKIKAIPADLLRERD